MSGDLSSRAMFTLPRSPFAQSSVRKRLGRGAPVVLSLEGAIEEMSAPRKVWDRRPPRLSLHDLRALVRHLADDRRVTRVAIDLRALRTGRACLTSLRELLAPLRQAGKRVDFHLPLGGASQEMIVASLGERLVLGPQSSVGPLGMAVHARYWRALLDRVGIQPEIVARGEFKTAGEAFVRQSMSEAQKVQLGAVLDTLYEELVCALSSGRRVTAEQARSWIDGGPVRAKDGVRLGLADAVGYEEVVPRGKNAAPSPVPAAQYLKSARRVDVRLGAAPFVGVVRVEGAIVSGNMRLPLGRLAVDEKVMSALRAARDNDKVRGVILLVDSPGGSVVASDRIRHEVQRLAERKPTFAYFSNVAASGGYYIATAAHRIIAQPTTITGSIGVVLARFVLAPLLAKWSVVTEVVKRGEHADMLSPDRPLSPAERLALEREIDGCYEDFVALVAQSRRRPASEIEPLARGRVYSGRDAHALGLVDQLGSFQTALEELRAHIGDSNLAARVLMPSKSASPASAPPDPSVAACSAALGWMGAEALEMAPLWALSRSERVLAYCPWAHALSGGLQIDLPTG